MDDGNINIDTRIDTSGIKSGVKDVNKEIEKVAKGNTNGKGIDKVNDVFKELAPQINLSKIATAGFAVTAAAGIKKVVDIMNDCGDAYQKQVKAERALATAAQNNPYLDKESVANLKSFAGELQKTSEIGDEISLGLMTQLAAAGRTESEIQKIMRASVDMSASGAISIEGAVKNLAKTYSGMAGELGESIPALRNLTAEEMKAGKAIDIVAGQFKGMADKTKDVNVQLANAVGDLKENIGRGWEEAMKPAKQALLDFITQLNESNEKWRAFQETTRQGKRAVTSEDLGKQENAEQMKKISTIISSKYRDILKPLEYESDAQRIQQTLKDITDAVSKTGNVQKIVVLEALSRYHFLNDEIITQVELLKKEENAAAHTAQMYQDLAIAKAKDDEKARKIEADRKAAAEKLKADSDAIVKQNKDALDKQIEQIKLKYELERKQLGTLTKDEEAKRKTSMEQEILNAKIQSYIALVTESGNAIAKTHPAVAERLKTIQKQSVALSQLNDEEKKRIQLLELAKKAIDEAQGIVNEFKPPIKKSDELKAKLDIAEEYGKRIAQLSDDDIRAATDGAKTKLQLEQELADAKEQINKEYSKAKKEDDEAARQDDIAKTQKHIENITSIFAQINTIARDISALGSKIVDDRAQAETDAVKDQYEQGIIGLEEYEKKKKEIERKAAREKYNLEMFAWTASLLSATANIALGITKALAQSGPLGIIQGILVGAAGAVQIAQIIASKPIPPKFAHGGIVPGASYSGDKVPALLNSREGVFTLEQQKRLFEIANGAGTNGMPSITINNNASDAVSTRPESVDNKQIIFAVDKIVSSGLEKGKHDNALMTMQKRQQGERYI